MPSIGTFPHLLLDASLDDPDAPTFQRIPITEYPPERVTALLCLAAVKRKQWSHLHIRIREACAMANY